MPGHRIENQDSEKAGGRRLRLHPNELATLLKRVEGRFHGQVESPEGTQPVEGD
jgi:hypothetical protein